MKSRPKFGKTLPVRYRRILLVSFVFFFFAALLAWLIFEPVRLFVALPLEFLAYLLRTLYLLVPHYAWWVAFLILAYVIAFNSLGGKITRFGWSAPPVEYAAEPRVARLARYIRLRGNPFYRHRLNHLLTEVALRALAYREHITLQQARLGVNRGTLDLPPEIANYLQVSLPPWPDQPFQTSGLFDWLFPPRHALDRTRLEAEQVLEFFEDQLEVPRED